MRSEIIMAWRNMWRNPRRSGLTMAAIAFACLLLVFMLSFQFGGYETMINASVKVNSGHLQVQAKGYQDNHEMRLVVDDPRQVAGLLSQINGINSFSFRAESFSLASSGRRTYGVAVIGIEPEKEKAMSTISDVVRQGVYLAGKDRGFALIGSLLAKNLKIGVGDEVTLLGQGRDGSVAATVSVVKGIFRTGIDELDRNTVQIPLADFQEVYAMDQAVHQVICLADRLSEVKDIAGTLRQSMAESGEEGLVVLDWTQLLPGLVQSIQMDLVSGLIMYLVLVLVVAFSILNTFLMAVFERTREFGLLMALGSTPGRLVRLLLLESMGLTVLGTVFGTLLGVLITLYFQSHGIEFPGAEEMLNQYGLSGRLYPSLSLLSCFAGPLLVLLVTFVSALYPALKVRKLKPVEAMG